MEDGRRSERHTTQAKLQDEIGSLLCTAAAELGRGHAEVALLLYRELLARKPGDCGLLNRIGDALVVAGRGDDALRHFFVVATSFERRHAPRQAMAMYRKILRLQPGDLGAQRAVDKLSRILDLPPPGAVPRRKIARR